jgi:hypothetical protein
MSDDDKSYRGNQARETIRRAGLGFLLKQERLEKPPRVDAG